MHNRVRLLVGSFLTKDLGIDWRWGERWFMRLLIDGDEANNNGNWQWIASVGVDPQPVFRRIYNPARHQERFDPEGEYVRRFVPELRPVPDRYLPEPWTMPEDVQEECGCPIGRDYPAPIVDHAKRGARRSSATASADPATKPRAPLALCPAWLQRGLPLLPPGDALTGPLSGGGPPSTARYEAPRNRHRRETVDGLGGQHPRLELGHEVGQVVVLAPAEAAGATACLAHQREQLPALRWGQAQQVITGDKSYFADGEQFDNGDTAQTGYPPGGVTEGPGDELRGHASSLGRGSGDDHRPDRHMLEPLGGLFARSNAREAGDQVDGEVKSRRWAARGDDASVVDHARLGVDLGSGLSEVLDRVSVGNRRTAGHKPRRGEEHRAGADRSDDGAGGVPLRDPGRQRTLDLVSDTGSAEPASAGDDGQFGSARVDLGNRDVESVGGANVSRRSGRRTQGHGKPGLGQDLERADRVEVVKAVK